MVLKIGYFLALNVTIKKVTFNMAFYKISGHFADEPVHLEILSGQPGQNLNTLFSEFELFEKNSKEVARASESIRFTKWLIEYKGFKYELFPSIIVENERLEL